MKTNNLLAGFSVVLCAAIALPAGAQEVCPIRSAAATLCLLAIRLAFALATTGYILIAPQLEELTW